MSAFANPPKFRYFVLKSIGSRVKIAVELTPDENVARFHSSPETDAHYHKKAVGRGKTAEEAIENWKKDVTNRALRGE